jgi:hypothetical protein
MDVWEEVEREGWMNILPETWAFKCKRFPDSSETKGQVLRHGQPPGRKRQLLRDVHTCGHLEHRVNSTDNELTVEISN